jgi:uncharacterized protein
MVTSVDRTVHPELDEIVRRLVGALNPVRIYLFGSLARHEATSDSDYDLLVLVPGERNQLNEKIDLAYDALWGMEAPVDVVVQTIDHFEERAGLRSSLAGTVSREGVLLYDDR